MKAYRFRLATVLRVRRIAEQAAREQLLSTQRALAEQELRCEQVLAALQASALPQAGSPAEFVHAAEQRAALASHLGEQRAAALRAREAVAEARAAWTEAAGAVTALERLDERHRAEHEAEVLREQDRLGDEVGTTRFQAAS